MKRTTKYVGLARLLPHRCHSCCLMHVVTHREAVSFNWSLPG
jgi:hypothetical protein